DPLYLAKKRGKLHRNFMGYTTSHATMLIGLGNSAISDIGYGFAQNSKDIEPYKASINKGEFSPFKGHFQTAEDQTIKSLILDLICNEKAEWKPDFYLNLSANAIAQLEDMEQDGLLEFNSEGIKVTSLGKTFIRNICSVFDRRMHEGKRGYSFSKSI